MFLSYDHFHGGGRSDPRWKMVVSSALMLMDRRGKSSHTSLELEVANRQTLLLYLSKGREKGPYFPYQPPLVFRTLNPMARCGNIWDFCINRSFRTKWSTARWHTMCLDQKTCEICIQRKGDAAAFLYICIQKLIRVLVYTGWGRGGWSGQRVGVRSSRHLFIPFF